MTSPKKKNSILFPIRLTPEADKLFRTSEKAYQIGNLTERVIAAANGVDLGTVKLHDRPRTPGMRKNADWEFIVTTVKLPPELRARLNEIAAERETSVSVLLDGAIRKFFKEKKSKK